MDKQDNHQARELWSLAFPEDSHTFKDWFFATQFPHLRRWFTWEKDKLLAMVYALPYTLMCRGKTIPAPLILGVATHPEVRRRGMMRQLLGKVHHDLAPISPAVCLHPSDCGFYRKLGYSVVSQQLSVCLPASTVSAYQPDGVVTSAPDCAQLARINQQHAQRMGFFAMRDESLLARRFADLQTGGGFCIRNDKAYAFVDPLQARELPRPPRASEPSGILQISEFSYTELPAGWSLLAALAQSFGACQLNFALMAEDVPQQWSRQTPSRRLTCTQEPFLMLNCLALPALVTGMGVPSLVHSSRPLRRVLHIHDDDTHWRITVTGGIAALSPAGAFSDVSLTRDQLIRWVCGCSDAAALAHEGVAQADCLSFLPKLAAFFFDRY